MFQAHEKTQVMSRVSDPYSFDTDPDPAEKNLQLKKKLNFFYYQKLQFTYPLAFIKDV
jgi:hypothetical protein